MKFLTSKKRVSIILIYLLPEIDTIELNIMNYPKNPNYLFTNFTITSI